MKIQTYVSDFLCNFVTYLMNQKDEKMENRGQR